MKQSPPPKQKDYKSKTKISIKTILSPHCAGAEHAAS